MSLSAPDSALWWWWWDTSLPGARDHWEIVFVVRDGTQLKGLFFHSLREEDVTDMGGLWCKVDPQPPVPTAAMESKPHET